jgi:hypothetical protein
MLPTPMGVKMARKSKLVTVYRVVYGETIPVWEQVFLTLSDALAFAKEHESFGDIIFNITRIEKWEQSA